MYHSARDRVSSELESTARVATRNAREERSFAAVTDLLQQAQLAWRLPGLWAVVGRGSGRPLHALALQEAQLARSGSLCWAPPALLQRGNGRPALTLVLPKAMCNGLQSKRAGPAISAFSGPHSVPLSPSSRPHYLPLRLQLSAWACNPSSPDHIICL